MYVELVHKCPQHFVTVTALWLHEMVFTQILLAKFKFCSRSVSQWRQKKYSVHCQFAINKQYWTKSHTYQSKYVLLNM